MLSPRYCALGVLVALVSFVRAQAPDWGQCGGIGYTGPTVCNPGWTCTYSNDYHSQCLQTSPDYWFSFGDSYTNTGFDINGTQPGPDNHLGNPAWPGKPIVNGPNWIAVVTGTSNTIDTAYNYNFATDKAVIDKKITPRNGSSLVEQVQSFTKWNSGSSRPAWGANAVFSLWFGMDDIDAAVQGQHPNDLSHNNKSIKSYSQQIQKLYNLGARRFVVLNVPPLDRSPKLLVQPAAKQASELHQISDFNAKLWTELASLQTNLTGSTISRYDVQSFYAEVSSHPSWYGLNDNFTSYGSSSDYFWFDDHHPGIQAQKQMAGEILRLVGGTV